MSYLEELLPEFRKGAKITKKEWGKKSYIYYKNGLIYDQNNQIMCNFSAKALSYDGWEFYQEHVDWDYIIKNKCLCWFWDGDGSRTINELKCVGEGEFYDDCCRTWENCRPVRKDEVTFYEDNKDE